MDYNLKQAAEYLGIAYNTIFVWIAKGHITPDYKLPSGRVRFKVETLDAAMTPIEKPPLNIESPAAKKRRARKVKEALSKLTGIPVEDLERKQC